MNLPPTLFSLVPFFLGFFFFVVGGLFFVLGLRSGQMQRASRSWSSVPGQVTGTDIQVKTFKFRTRMGGTRTDYRPVINYEYNVLGIPYQSSQITFGTIQVDQAHAQAMLAKYPPGSAVTVYYNPKKPQQAVLEHGGGGMAWVVLVGGFVSLIGLCLGCFGVTMLTSLVNTPK
jgi:hypothetical protein